MRSLSADQIIEKNKRDNIQIRTLLEIDTGSETLRYSDQFVTYGVFDYLGKVLEWNPVDSQAVPGDNVIRTAAWGFKLLNFPRRDDQLKPGQVVRGYIFYDNHGLALGKIPVTWTAPVRVLVTPHPNDLEKDDPPAAWNAGAISNETITQGERKGVSFQAGQSNKYIACGLSSSNPDNDWDTIGFGIRLRSDNEIEAIESGVVKYGPTGSYLTTDIFSIEVNSAGRFEYKQNGVTFYTSTATPLYPLFVDTSIYNDDAAILDVHIIPAEVALIPIFTGTIQHKPKLDYYGVSVYCEDMGEKFDNVIGTLLDSATYPNADPDHIGRMIPVGIGEVFNHPCLASDIGGITTLAQDLDDSSTAPIKVADVSQFIDGISSVWIGEERIRFTDTDIDGNGVHWIQGSLSRGFSGTTATTHSRGDAAIEHGAWTFKAFDIKSKLLTNARFLPAALPLKDAVFVGDLATYDLNNSEVVFANFLALIEQVAIVIAQQPGVSLQQEFAGSADHSHIAAGNKTITYFMDDVFSSQFGGSQADISNVVDGNFATASLRNAYTSFDMKVTKVGIEQYDGVPKQQRARIQVSVSSGTVSIKMRLFIGGVQKEEKTITVTTTPLNYSTSFYSLGTFDWVDFTDTANNYIQVISNGALGIRFLFESQVWSEVQYLPGFETETISDGIIATTAGTEVQLGGDAVTAIRNGRLIVDAECVPDSGGHYTGSGTGLIEDPPHVFHYLLENFGNGVTDDDIDLAGSFADAESNLPASYKYSFVLYQQIKLNQLLAQLASQAWCRFRYGADGKARLDRILSSGTPTKALDTDDSVLKGNRFDVRRTEPDLDGIINTVELLYDPDLTRQNRHDPDAYFGLSEDSDAGSITTYGVQKRPTPWLMFAIGQNQTMADDIAGKLLDLLKTPRQHIHFPSAMWNIELEPGDIPTVNSAELEMSAVLHELLGFRYTPPSAIDGRPPQLLLDMIDIS